MFYVLFSVEPTNLFIERENEDVLATLQIDKELFQEF